MDSFIPQLLHYNSVPVLMLIRLDAQILADLPLVHVCSWIQVLSLGNAKSKLLFFNPLLKLSTDLCLLQVAKLFGYNDLSVNLGSFLQVLLHSMLTAQAPSKLLQILFFMSRLNFGMSLLEPYIFLKYPPCISQLTPFTKAMVISHHNFLITKFMLCQASHQFEGKCREGVHKIKLVPRVQIYLRRSFL